MVTLVCNSQSETLGNDEVYFLTDYLAAQGWIIKGREIRSGATIWDATNGTYLCSVTVPGYQQVEQMQAAKQTSQCFVAMWFDRSMDEAYDYGIEPAVEQAGYTPMRIDRKDDLIDKIDDAIIAEIRRSRFLIADFTHGEQGARGGVYYEAGFAQGIGIPVIFLCQNDRMEDVHFDTRQFFHIVWDSPGDLKEKLYNRIVAYCPASTIFAGWRQSVLPVHLLGLAPLLGSIGPVAGDVKLQDDGVVHDPVNRRGGGHGVGEDALPLREDQV